MRMLMMSADIFPAVRQAKKAETQSNQLQGIKYVWNFIYIFVSNKVVFRVSEIFHFSIFFVRNHLIKIPAEIEKSSAASLPRTFASESEFNDNRLELIYSFTYVHRGGVSRALKNKHETG